MKRPLDTLRYGLPTKQTTPFNRLIALALFIVNTPILFMGTFVTLLTFWAIVPLVWYVPSLILYRRFWKMYKDNATIDYARETWKRTILINMLVILCMIYLGSTVHASWTFYLATCPPIAMILMAYVAYAELEENEPFRTEDAIYTYSVEGNPQA